MKPRIKANNWGEVQLTQDIDAVVDTFTVDDVSVFINFPFRAVIESEYIEVHGKDVGTSALTGVVRGLENSTGVAHDSGAWLSNLHTAGTQNEGDGNFAENENGHSGLNFAYFGGSYRVGALYRGVSAGAVLLADDAVNLVYLNPITDAMEAGLTLPSHCILKFTVTTAAGQIITVVDNRTTQAWGDGLPGVILWRESAQSITHDTNTAIIWTHEDSNNSDGIFDSAHPTRLYAPVAGIYHISSYIQFAVNTTGTRSISSDVNNAGDWFHLNQVPATVGYRVFGTSGSVFINQGGYAEVKVFQNSTASLNIEYNNLNAPMVSMVLLSPMEVS